MPAVLFTRVKFSVILLVEERRDVEEKGIRGKDRRTVVKTVHLHRLAEDVRVGHQPSYGAWHARRPGA